MAETELPFTTVRSGNVEPWSYEMVTLTPLSRYVIQVEDPLADVDILGSWPDAATSMPFWKPSDELA